MSEVNEVNENLLVPVSITMLYDGMVVADDIYDADAERLIIKAGNVINDIQIDKISSLEVLEEYFERDESFSLSEYSAQSFGIYQEAPIDVVLEFDKSVADDALNYHFHPTQKIKKLESGNVQVKFTSGGTQAICHELFKWGASVKIKTPKELRRIYKGYLEDALSSL